MDWDETFTITDGFYSYNFDSNNEIINLYDFFMMLLNFYVMKIYFIGKKV